MNNKVIIIRLTHLRDLVDGYRPLLSDDNEFYSPKAISLRREIQELYYELEPYIQEAIGNPQVEIYQQQMPAFESSFSEMNSTASFYAIRSVPQLINKTIAYYKRKPKKKITEEKKPSSNFLYITESVINLIKKKDDNFDYSKLEVLVNELNKAHLSKDTYAVLSLIRAVEDHIPPLLGFSSFIELASNYFWGETDKKYLKQLIENRTLSDDVLHRQISNKKDLFDFEDLPPRAALNRVLQEALVNGVGFDKYIEIKKERIKKLNQSNKKKAVQPQERPLVLAELLSMSSGPDTYQVGLNIKNYGSQPSIMKKLQVGDFEMNISNIGLVQSESRMMTLELNGTKLRKGELDNPNLVVTYQDITGNDYKTVYELVLSKGNNGLLRIERLSGPINK